MLNSVRLSESPSDSVLATASTDEENIELFYKKMKYVSDCDNLYETRLFVSP